jgi:hypothetical protein
MSDMNLLGSARDSGAAATLEVGGGVNAGRRVVAVVYRRGRRRAGLAVGHPVAPRANVGRLGAYPAAEVGGRAVGVAANGTTYGMLAVAGMSRNTDVEGSCCEGDRIWPQRKCTNSTRSAKSSR